MDVQINIPVIKEIHCDLLFKASPTDMAAMVQENYLQVLATESNFTAILTGEDQLEKEVPDMYDETKKDSLSNFTDFQRASASEVIWARIDRAKDRVTADNALQKALNPSGKVGWLYGIKQGAITGLDYNQVAQHEVGDLGKQFQTESAMIDNIPRGGYKLLKDHVNMFVKTHQLKPGQEGFELRFMIDYDTDSVPLSSLLVWRQQLTEFIPKQIQWRAGVQEPGSSKKNGYRFLISRGTVKETGDGTDPSDATQFPNIDD